MTSFVSRIAHRFTPAALLALALAPAACGDDIDDPTEQDYDELAHNVAPVMAHEYAADGLLSISVDIATGNAPASLALETDGTLTGNLGGLSWHVSLTCRDALGLELDACGETADRASLDLSLSGTLDLGGFTGSLDIDHTSTLSGLQGDTVRATGDTHVTGATRFTGTLIAVERTFDLDYDASWDVSFPVDEPTAAEGSIQASVDARRTHDGPNTDVDAHFVVDVAVTLPGDGTAVIVLDGEASYRLDLETGALVKI